MMRGSRRRWTRLRVVVVAAAMVAAFIAASVNGGARYLYCGSMHQVMNACCCPPDEAPASRGPEIGRACCCTAHIADALPDRAPSSESQPPPAPPPIVDIVIAVVKPGVMIGAFASAPEHRQTGPPQAAERRARIQVYLL